MSHVPWGLQSIGQQWSAAVQIKRVRGLGYGAGTFKSDEAVNRVRVSSFAVALCVACVCVCANLFPALDDLPESSYVVKC